MTTLTEARMSPLEDFFRSYLETAGGVWEEVEPQVYDIMMPSRETADAAVRPWEDREILRVVFDAEALPEHAGAQLASFGSPLVDRLLGDAVARGRSAHLFYTGLNLLPYQLDARIRRSLRLADGLDLELRNARPLWFPQAIFWFQATFTSDEREQDLLSVGFDLHYARQVRHLERLVDPALLAEQPSPILSEVQHITLAAAHELACERVKRTLSALANSRARELAQRLEKQTARIARYYQDLRDEIAEQSTRAEDRGQDVSRHVERRAALEREETIRIAELKQKSTLRVQLRLLNLLVVHQPKLLVPASLRAHGRSDLPFPLVWDPLTEATEAPTCPECRQPSFEWHVTPLGHPVCPACSVLPPKKLSAKPGKRLLNREA